LSLLQREWRCLGLISVTRPLRNAARSLRYVSIRLPSHRFGYSIFLILPPRGRDLLSWRLNMDIHQAGLHDNALQHSLSTIEAAKTQFHLLTGGSPTPTALVWQIRLCDVLLGEIRAIRSSLERRMRCRGEIRRRPVAAKHSRSRRHPAVPQGNPANRSGCPR
jgi:hypothetical protein